MIKVKSDINLLVVHTDSHRRLRPAYRRRLTVDRSTDSHPIRKCFTPITGCPWSEVDKGKNSFSEGDLESGIEQFERVRTGTTRSKKNVDQPLDETRGPANVQVEPRGKINVERKEIHRARKRGRGSRFVGMHQDAEVEVDDASTREDLLVKWERKREGGRTGDKCLLVGRKCVVKSRD